MSCKAVRNTWSHQRKRRRLRLRLAKLSQQTGSGQSGEDVGPVTMATGQTAEPQEESQNLVGQLEELSAPCRMEFQLRVSIGEGAPGRSSPEPPSTKRMKGEGTEANSNSERCVMATLEFVSGDTPDQLHQIMQYFKNQLSSPLSTVSPLPPRTTS